jgi:ankyrin repeat protein
MAQPLRQYAVHAAVRALDIDALRCALAAGGSIEEQDENGWTPLYCACANKGHHEDDDEFFLPDYWNERVSDRVAMVRALLDAGASVHARCDEPDDTPLHAAVMNDNFPSNDIVEMLIAAGADIHNTNGEYHYSVLYAAAQCGRRETVTTLIAAGADIHQKYRGSYTPLAGARICGKVRNYAPLLRAGAAMAEPDRRDAYLRKIAATPGGYPAYERAHRARLAAIFIPKFPGLPVEVIHHIVSIWADCGGH